MDVQGNAAFLLREGRPDQEVMQYLIRYLMVTEEKVRPMLASLKAPFNTARIFSYTVGKQLLHPWLARSDRRTAFSRLLTQQLCPSELTEEKTSLKRWLLRTIWNAIRQSPALAAEREQAANYDERNNVLMLYYLKVRVDYQRLTPEELWEQWEKEADAALRAKAAGSIVALYKVVGQRLVLVIVDMTSHDELDRSVMDALPLAHYEQVEEILPLREYESFANDMKRRWK